MAWPGLCGLTKLVQAFNLHLPGHISCRIQQNIQRCSDIRIVRWISPSPNTHQLAGLPIMCRHVLQGLVKRLFYPFCMLRVETYLRSKAIQADVVYVARDRRRRCPEAAADVRGMI